MNVAIVGCGMIADTHASALRALGHKLVLAVSRTMEGAEAFSKKWHVARYSNVLSDDLLHDVDCVHICTPPASHYELVKQCLELSKHVICEKPLCLSAEHAKELMQLAKSKGVTGAVNFNVRYYQACGKAKEIISQQDFGRTLMVQCNYQQEFHALPEAYSWRYQPEISGPMRATTEIGSHCIDLIRHWTDLKITSVSANFGCFTPLRQLSQGLMHREPQDYSSPVEVKSEDAAVISLQFENGAIGCILLSEIAHGRHNSIKLEVTGDTQSVWWESESPYHLHTATKGGGINTAIDAFSQSFTDTVTQFIEQVYAAITSGSQQNTFPDFSDGYVNSLICDAIYESAQNKAQWIEIEDY
ncbi:MAG: Gfo/Idh/MocA family oxidoreductase [Halioglobus sp.]